jgi:hypothetical protein
MNTQHTFQINATQTSTKTATIRALRETKHVVSASNTVTTKIDDTIRSMIQTGSLTDVCTWHGKAARKVCGEKPVVRESETATAVLKARMQSEVEALVKPAVKKLYRQAQSGWAGGNTIVTVKIDSTPDVSGYSQRVWSENGKWSGNDAYITVAVMANFKRSIGNVTGLITAGGMLTTHATKIAEDCWMATWAVQGRGFDLNTVSGFIVRSAEGEWCHAKTEKAARKLATTRDAVVRAERERLAQLAAEKLAANSDLYANLDLVVTLDDSRSAGNCSTGTQAWINLHFPGRTLATIREIIAADPGNSRALATCRMAIKRQIVTA